MKKLQQEPDLTTPGGRFAAVRLALGYETQEAFGAALGKVVNKDMSPIDPASMSKYETGGMSVSQKVLRELISRGVNVAWIETGDGNMMLPGVNQFASTQIIADDQPKESPEKNVGENTKYYSQTIDNQQKNNLDLISGINERPKTDKPYAHESHNKSKTPRLDMQYFATLLPTDDDRNGWSPYVSSLEPFINYLTSGSADADLSKWPVEFKPDGFHRVGALYDLMFVYGRTNIEEIPSGSRVGVKKIDKEDYDAGNYYLVVFVSKKHGIYKASEGRAPGHVRLTSSKAEGGRDWSFDKILFMLVVVTVARPMT